MIQDTALGDGVLILWQARQESNPQPAVLETAALPIELLACVANSPWLMPYAICQLFCFPVKGMNSTPGTVLPQFQTAGVVPPILTACVIAFLALSTRKGNWISYSLLSHL